MKKLKTLAVISIMLLIISATSIIVFAAAYDTPAQALADISGKDLETVIAERKEKNIRYGTMAKEAGSLEEFRKEMLEIKKAVLKERVKTGTITQEKADEIIVTMEKNYDNCDGTGQKGQCGNIGQKNGIGFGNGYGAGECKDNARWNGKNFGKAK